MSFRYSQVRAFSSVALSDMIVQIRTDGESSIATLNCTSERFDSLVESQVLPQMRRLSVRLATDFTQILPWTRRSLMNAAFTWKSCRTFDSIGCRAQGGAWIAFLLVFLVVMIDKLCCRGEDFRATFT